MKTPKQRQNSLVLYRRRMGFTQRQVARLLGYADTSMISHYEHGRSFPPLLIALSLEIIFRVPVAFLFPGLYEDLRQKLRKIESELAGYGQLPLF